MSLTVGRNQTVMVVDDCDDVRELMVMQLRLAGYDVVEARNGQEAVGLATANCPALIFMDVQMPLMDGVEATRAIRAVAALCGVVIVVFSAFSSGDNRRRALEAGCDEYVSKNEGINRLAGIAGRYLAAA